MIEDRQIIKTVYTNDKEELKEFWSQYDPPVEAVFRTESRIRISGGTFREFSNAVKPLRVTQILIGYDVFDSIDSFNTFIDQQICNDELCVESFLGRSDIDPPFGGSQLQVP